MKAKCEVVARAKDGQQEARFYADGQHVKTVHLEPKDAGKYVEGQEYDVEPDQSQSTRSSPPVSEHDTND